MGKDGGYREDIDWLRAIAVLPVVAFHFEIPGIWGGYVGVDIFFVIWDMEIRAVEAMAKGRRIADPENWIKAEVAKRLEDFHTEACPQSA
jgi:hypothetical protein